MLLQALRNRVKRYLSPPTVQTPEGVRQSAAEARDNRATAVSDLQEVVHRLQRAIADLSLAMEGGLDDGMERAAANARLAALQAELVRTQRNLAQYQGRI